MPLKKCSSDNNNGWKWGDAGKCYTGPDGKKKAIKQGIVIEGPKKFREKASSLEGKFTAEEIKGVAAVMIEEGHGLMETASIILFMRSQS